MKGPDRQSGGLDYFQTRRHCWQMSVLLHESGTEDQTYMYMIPSTFPKLPWQKVGMDLFECQKFAYLKIVDYYSRFIKIAKLDRATADALQKISSQDTAYLKRLLRTMGHSLTSMHSVSSQKSTSFTI